AARSGVALHRALAQQARARAELPRARRHAVTRPSSGVGKPRSGPDAFAFATALPGMERAVKLEVAEGRPELRFAFSRPGLCTFKSSRPVTPEDAPGSAFARVWGASL